VDGRHGIRSCDRLRQNKNLFSVPKWDSRGGRSVALVMHQPLKRIPTQRVLLYGCAAVMFSYCGQDMASAESRFVNISSRAFAPADPTGGNPVIAGFVVAGAQPKQILIRAVGSGLTDFGVPDPIRDPKVALFDSAHRLLTVATEAWDKGNFVRIGDTVRYTATPAEIYQAFMQVGAFPFKGWRPGQAFRNPLSDVNPYEAGNDRALLVTLDPGPYSVVVSEGAGSGGGVLLIEVYEVDQHSRLVNISTRAPVSTGTKVLIAGFVVSGTEPRTMLIRGIGPGLKRFGVAATLSAPRLRLFRNGTALATYGMIDLQSTDSQTGIAESGSSAGAFSPLGSDCAAVVTVAPGVYSAILDDRDGATGTGLLEIYEIFGNHAASLPLALPDFTVADGALGPKDLARNRVTLSPDESTVYTLNFGDGSAAVTGVPGKTSYPYVSYLRTGPVKAILRLGERFDGTGPGIIYALEFGRNTLGDAQSGRYSATAVRDLTNLPYEGTNSEGFFTFATGFFHGPVPESKLAPATFAKATLRFEYTDGRIREYKFTNVGGTQNAQGVRTIIAYYERWSDTTAGLQMGFPSSIAGPGTIYHMAFGTRSSGSFTGVDTSDLLAGPNYPGERISGTFTVPILPPTGY
jgi:hypothetical protein